MATQRPTLPDDPDEDVDVEDWTDNQVRAWQTMETAQEGDTVLYNNRQNPVEVLNTGKTEDGRRYLDVEMATTDGSNRVEMQWQNGRPMPEADDGTAYNLRFGKTQESRGLSKNEYIELLNTLTENAIDVFVRLDYEEWGDAVEDVVDDWVESVAFRDWRGYRHHPNWEEGDVEAIFESVATHALEEAGGGRMAQPEGEDLVDSRKQAEVVLYDEIYREGRAQAEDNLITSPADYAEVTEQLSNLTIDRIEQKNYTDAREATRDTVSDWMDDRTANLYESILAHGTERFDDDLYMGLEAPVREKAFDTLEADVWERVQSVQRERGEHDPTVRGMTFSVYQETVDLLALRAAKEWGGSGFLRTYAHDVVTEWADEVEAEQWEGHRFRAWVNGDVEDIFMSAVVHSDADPRQFRPFERRPERKMAIEALVPPVLRQANDLIDERGEELTEVDADQFVQEAMGDPDATYEELFGATEEEVDEFLAGVVNATNGQEVGWTFAEEILAAGGQVVETTNDWTILDYGVVRVNDTVRKLAWMNQETGEVLILEVVCDDSMGGVNVWDEDSPAHVLSIEWDAREPEWYLSDKTIGEALEFIYDYTDADQADLLIVEDSDGQVRLFNGITPDDINVGGMLESLVPNINIRTRDLRVLGGAGARAGLSFVSKNWAPITAVAAFALLRSSHPALAIATLGTNLRPDVDKKKGIGLKGTRALGAAAKQAGVGGQFEGEIYIRNRTFRELAEKHTPNFIRYGFEEGDVLKGPVIAVGKNIDRYRKTYEDPVVPEILEKGDLNTVPEAEVRDLARRAERDFESEDAWDDIDTLREKVYGYANYYDPETVTWGGAFLDTYAGSVGRLRDIMQRGTEQTLEEELDSDRQTVGSVATIEEGVVPYDPTNVPGTDDYEYSWDDMRRTDLGISGIMLRGLKAEDLHAGAKWLGVEKWLKKGASAGVQKGSEWVEGEKPTFEEWQDNLFGPGRDGGPEQEARRFARYHKAMARARRQDPPDPMQALGYSGPNHGEITDEQDDLGDYDLDGYDPEDEFFNQFEETADRFAEGEPADSRDAVNSGHK